MEFEDAAVRVLAEEGRPLHWTVVQDLALKRGYLDPFTQRDIRKHLLAAISAAARAGRLTKVDRGTYAITDAGPDGRVRDPADRRQPGMPPP